MKRALLAGLSAMTGLVANAIAATATCPPIQSIHQTAMAGGGYSYEASQPGGLTWTGKNPSATASYLNDSTFHDARYDAQNEAVTCTYKGPMGNDAQLSVTLKSVEGWNLTPIGYWKGTYCEDSDATKCSFTHR
ncbi:DUF3757 domain-containing protein [Pseudomonas sp. O64]|uniref:DUF3757 domain-containing protein n=2 Tax=Pseudomonas TaxID=286 RepID=UPI001F567D64|nr:MULTISPECIES: DUF3757 domain-containing protein [unclassified Pseudomonas]UNM19591.1 DUF3757 domain-containing protein [Pseudomonas sp. ArH3a]UXZ22347.1 DUF3757 domain-containing protein [Pseudomonas sp. YeP6b]